MERSLERDSGFHYFRDYYHQVRSEEEARNLLREGQVVAVDPPAGGLFMVVELTESGFVALSLKDFTHEIRPKFRDIVFPGNILYALDFDNENEELACKALKEKRGIAHGKS